jgi:ATP-binding cassette subfamily B protein
MNLLIGYRRPISGAIYLDDIPMETIDLRKFRRHLSVVSQNILLFSGSIRENILYGLDHDDVDEDFFQNIVEMSRVNEFVNQLPQGLDTKIGEHGGKLSGGQRQRIAIARALIRNPRIIIFDEATSALDVESERLIQEAIEGMIKGRTTFMIAHRLSTIRHADRIVVLKNGTLMEIGNHEKLMAKHGVYYKMHLFDN